MDNNFPSIYLGQSVDFFYPPEIPLDQMNEEQKASYNYWKQYAGKHHITYDLNEETQVLSNFRAIERPYEETDKDLLDMVVHVNEKRKGSFLRLFYFLVAVIAYLFLAIHEKLFQPTTHCWSGLIAFILLVLIFIRFKHYFMHPDRRIVARVLLLNEQKQKSWQLATFSKKHWEKL